jgi:hypothetical protein
MLRDSIRVVTMKRFSAVFLLFGVLACAACDSSGSSPSTPTTPSNVSTSFTQVMFGTIEGGKTPFHSFTVPSTAPLHIMLGSLTTPAEVPLGATATLVFGVTATDGVSCLALTKVSATPALKAQINVTASKGEYCLALEDIGAVPVGSLYAIRTIYGTPNDDTESSVVEYTSSVLANGATSRSFATALDGTVGVSLTAISPASVAALGVALGFQRNDGSGCHITVAYTAPRGFSTTQPIDAGRYCIKIFDPGTLTDPAAFTVRIVHP